MARQKAQNPVSAGPFWLDRKGNRHRTHEGRRPTRLEQRREDCMQAWFGETLAPGEITARQQPAQPISAAIDEVIYDLARQRVPLLDQVRLHWPQVVGSDLAKATAPVALRGKTLHVEVKNVTLQYVLERERKADLEKAVRTFTDAQVQSIRFVPSGRRRPGE